MPRRRAASLANEAMSAATPWNASSSGPRTSREKRTRSAIALISPGATSISPTVPTVPRPASTASRSSSNAICEHCRRVEPEAHQGRAGMVAATADDHVGVDVSGDGADDSDPVAGVLQDLACSMCISIQPVSPSRMCAASLQRAGSKPACSACAQKLRPSSTARNVSRSSSSVTRCATMRLRAASARSPSPPLPGTRSAEAEARGRARRSGGRPRERTTPIVPSYLPPFRFESQWEPIPNRGSPPLFLATSVPTGSSSTPKPSSCSAPSK